MPRTLSRSLSALAAFCLLLGLVPSRALAFADRDPGGAQHALGEAPQGSLMRTGPGGGPLPLETTDIRASVVGVLATVEIEQVFHNPSGEAGGPIEALYLFPVPRAAAVTDVRMRVGVRTLAARMKRRDEARTDYAAAVADGRQAALVEQRSRDVYSTRVANIRPGDEIRVRLTYVQTLGYDGGAYTLGIPLAVRPRPERSAKSDDEPAPTAAAGTGTRRAKASMPRYLPEGVRPGYDVTIAVDVDPGLPVLDVSSPSHQIAVERKGDARCLVRLARAGEIPNRDFELRVAVAGDAPGAACMATPSPDGGAFFTVVAVPPADAFSSGVMAKELVCVVDTSGSMDEEGRIADARSALRVLLHGLNPGDAFNVIRFSDDYSAMSSASLPFTQESLDAADRYVDGLTADGGTESAPAIRHALRLPPSDRRVRLVAFITDGELGDPDALMAMLDRELGSTRLFTFGIGPATDDFLSRKMAEAGRGTSRLIAPGGGMASALASFQNSVAAPVLADVSVRLEGAEIVDMSPSPVPDLYASSPLVLYGKADRVPEGAAVVEATGPAGRLTFTVPVKVEEGARGDAVRSLWARSAVDRLLDRLRGEPDNDAVKEEIASLGVAYRVATPFTSFVVADETPAVAAGTPARRIVVPLPRPASADVSAAASGSGPTPPGAPASDVNAALMPAPPAAVADEQAGVPPTAPASGEATGSIQGRVTDPTGAVIPNAVVELVGSQKVVSSATGDDGGYQFRGVGPGVYAMSVTAPGFGRQERRGVPVELGRTLDVAWELMPAGSAETVDVTLSEGMVTDVTSTKIATNVPKEGLNRITTTLNFGSAINVASGMRSHSAGSGFAVDGASGAENVYAMAVGGATGGTTTNANRPSNGRGVPGPIAPSRTAPPATAGGATAESGLGARADRDAESFLLGSQLASGAWADRGAGVSADDEVASTAAVLLAYLGAGQTDRAGWRQAQVRRGLDYLLAQVGRDGALRGVNSTRAEALALWALSEAAAATRAPRYAEAAARVAAHLAWRRLASGLWPETRTGAGDPESTAWAAIALAAARSAGAPVNAQVIEAAGAALRATPGATAAARALVTTLAPPVGFPRSGIAAGEQAAGPDGALFATLAARLGAPAGPAPQSAVPAAGARGPVRSAADTVLALAARGGHWVVLRGK